MARPSKRTPERAGAILRGLEAGLTRTAASGQADIDLLTFERWMNDNEAFRSDVLRAEAKAEARFAAVMAQAASPHDVVETTETTGPDGKTVKVTTRREFDWRAAESWLKRRRRKEWSENVNIGIDAEIAELMALVAGQGQTEAPGRIEGETGGGSDPDAITA